MIDVKESRLFNKGYFIDSLEADNVSLIKRFEGPEGMCTKNRWIENFPIDDKNINNKLCSIEFDHFIDKNPDRFDKIIIHFDNDSKQDYCIKVQTFDKILNEFWKKYSLFSDILNTVAELGYHACFHIYDGFKTCLLVELLNGDTMIEETTVNQGIEFGNYYEEIIMQLRKLLKKAVDRMKDKVKQGIDVVNHPGHYETGKFECIEVMQEVMGVDAVKDFCICNVFKYVYRHKNKNGLEDLKKAQWYLNKYLELSKEE